MKLELGKTIKNSFSVAKKSKWLWIYGILAASTTSSYNFSRSISSQDFQNLPISLPASLESLERVVTTWVSQINPGQIGLFFSSIGVFTIFGIILSIIITSWSEAALIFGTNKASDGDNVDLSNTSPTGLSKLKEMIIFKIIAGIMTIAVILAVVIPFGIIISILVATKINVAAALIGIVAIVIFFWAMIALTGASLYGPRAIVLKNYSPWNAWKNGFKMGRVYAIKTVAYGFFSGIITSTTSFIGVLVSLFVLGLPAYLIVAPLIDGSSSFSLVKVLPLPLLILVFVWFNTGLVGAVRTFQVQYWNQVFERLWKEK